MNAKKIRRVKRLDAQIHINVPEWLKDTAAFVADSEGVNLSDYVRDLIKADLKARGPIKTELDQVA